MCDGEMGFSEMRERFGGRSQEDRPKLEAGLVRVVGEERNIFRLQKRHILELSSAKRALSSRKRSLEAEKSDTES